MNGATLCIVGNLTRDPELRYTSGGRPVASMSVAVGRRYQKEGEWTETTSFFNVTAWGDLAEHATECLTKGMRVIVEGRYESRDYENQEGEKRTVWDLTADDIGPSVRWAKVSVERIERDKPAEHAPSAPRASDPPYGDEEPF